MSTAGHVHVILTFVKYFTIVMRYKFLVGPYEQGGIATANKKLTREEESTKRKVAHLKELHW